jgi:hypothetical protein
MSAVIELGLTLGKSTKNKHVYNGEGDSPVIPSVYIERSALSNPPPQTITITIHQG